MNRARSAAEFREALRPWHVPTFNVVFADVEGHIGYHATGRVPIRNVCERGYRPGWEPKHQWNDLVPFDGMPSWIDPERGWLATANARPAPEDFPYPLSGTWLDDYRMRRIREMIEAKPRLSVDDHAAMHQDCVSLRAVNCVPKLLAVLPRSNDARVQQATAILAAWDCRMTEDEVGPTIFDVFFAKWTEAVAQARFQGDTAALLATGVNGLAASLLADDARGWFPDRDQGPNVIATFLSAIQFLTAKLGPDMSGWTWGKLHTMPLRHVLSGRGDLAQLLDHGGVPVRGDMTTVCNTGLGPDFSARTGAGFRMIADLGVSPPGVWSIDGQSQSGHPGSPHYRDQLSTWLAGQYHHLSLERSYATQTTAATLMLQPPGE
jgi:penicillin amidase